MIPNPPQLHDSLSIEMFEILFRIVRTSAQGHPIGHDVMVAARSVVRRISPNEYAALMVRRERIGLPPHATKSEQSKPVEAPKPKRKYERPGRPTVQIPPERVQALIDAGMSYRKIGRELQISAMTVCRMGKRTRIQPTPPQNSDSPVLEAR